MEILKKILSEKFNRKQLIKEFQELIWNGELSEDETLSQLAYDLDFYEPDDSLRKEDSSYFGDKHLEEEINEVLKKFR